MSEKKTLEDDIFVLDTTAQPGVDRTHEMLIEGRLVPFTFKYATPLKLPFAIAMKFVNIAEFVSTDENGVPTPFKRTPVQPEQLQAGQRFRLADDETVARYDELTIEALLIRAAIMPGGEAIKRNSGKQAIIDFLQETAKARRAANVQNDIDPDSFIPEPEDDDLLSQVA